MAAMPSSNSWAVSHPRSSTHRLRNRAMWAGGPAEADDADASPLADDRGELARRRCVGRLGHAGLTPWVPNG